MKKFLSILIALMLIISAISVIPVSAEIGKDGEPVDDFYTPPTVPTSEPASDYTEPASTEDPTSHCIPDITETPQFAMLLSEYSSGIGFDSVSVDDIDVFYNDYVNTVVFGFSDNLCTVSEQDIDGYHFENWNFFPNRYNTTGYCVYYNGVIYSIADAVANNIMSARALSSIIPHSSKIDNTTVSTYYTDPSSYPTEPTTYSTEPSKESVEQLRDRLNTTLNRIMNSMPVGGTPYTTESSARFRNAVKAARNAVNNAEATKAELIEAYNELVESYKGLEYSTADRDAIWDAIYALEALIDYNDAHGIDTTELRELYSDAMPIAYYEPEQSVIDEMTAKINKAIGRGPTEPTIYTNPTETTEPSTATVPTVYTEPSTYTATETVESPTADATEPVTVTAPTGYTEPTESTTELVTFSTEPVTDGTIPTEPATETEKAVTKDSLKKFVVDKYSKDNLTPEDVWVDIFEKLSDKLYLVRYTVSKFAYIDLLSIEKIGDYVYTTGYPKAEIFDGENLYEISDAYKNKLLTDSDLAAIAKILPSFKKESKNLKDAVIVGITNKTYTGKEIKQSIEVRLLGNGYIQPLEPKYFTVTYSNNKNAGTATITVKGRNGYTGKISKTFKIAKAENPITLSVKKSIIANSKKSTTIKSTVKVTKAQGAVSYKTSNSKVKVKNGSLIISKGLKKGKTYTVKITATAKGSKNYKSGSKTVTVKIKVK